MKSMQNGIKGGDFRHSVLLALLRLLALGFSTILGLKGHFFYSASPLLTIYDKGFSSSWRLDSS